MYLHFAKYETSRKGKRDMIWIVGVLLLLCGILFIHLYFCVMSSRKSYTVQELIVIVFKKAPAHCSRKRKLPTCMHHAAQIFSPLDDDRDLCMEHCIRMNKLNIRIYIVTSK